MDAVLLAHFSRAPRKGQTVDLYVGNSAIGLLLSEQTQVAIDIIELQSCLADMARRNVALNHLDEQMTVRTIDLKDGLPVIWHNSYNLVVCNPPYFEGLPAGKTNPSKHLAVVRHEVHTTLEEVIDDSGKLLKTSGCFAMVHRPERFLEIIRIMQNHWIAPKRIQFVYPKVGKETNTLLAEGIKEGKLDGFKVALPLIAYNADGEYTAEIREMPYGK